MTDWLPDAIRYAEQWLSYQVRCTEVPGCVLAIAADGAVVAERAFGVADLANGERMTPRHRFRVASHSKTFTAAGILKLREAGRLHLDDPVGRFVEGLEPAAARVTIQQLLSHGAGLLRDGSDASFWQLKAPFFDHADLRRELEQPPAIEANTRFKYSNIGFGLLGLVIEAVAGEAYETWIMREIVEPSGLSETAPDCPLPEGLPLASGYGRRSAAGSRPCLDGRDTPTHALASATGFVSTAGDLARFFGSLDPDGPGGVLSAASRREMTRPQRGITYADGKHHYGLGMITGSIRGHNWFGHLGRFPGFISRTMAVPDWRIAVSIVTNAIDAPANAWTDGVIDIMHHFSRHGPATPDAAEWTGRWQTIWGVTDLVPMGEKVLCANPAALSPFIDGCEITITGPNEGRISQIHGLGSYGEKARRILDADGATRAVWLGGAELLPEQDGGMNVLPSASLRGA